MPTLHDLMADSIDGQAQSLRAAAALPATRGLIARRRRRNAAVAGGTSALAIGGLVAAGIVQDARRDDAPAASTDPDAVAFATVPAVTEQGPHVDLSNDSRIACGDAVLDSSASLDGFSLETKLFTGSDTRPTMSDDNSLDKASLSNKTSILSTVTYEGSPHSPVFLDVGYGVLAKDGVVVAIVDHTSRTGSLRFDPLLPGSTWSEVANLGQVQFCEVNPLATSDEFPTLYAGDYEFYAIAQATVTEEMIGLNVLASAGYGPAGTGGAWAPGSIDCTNAIGDREADWAIGAPAIPLPCEPDAIPGAVIDVESGTISVPYPARDYTEDVAVTLVSNAIPLHLDEDLSFEEYAGLMLGDNGPAPTPTAVSDLACNVDFVWVQTDAAVYAKATDGIDTLMEPGGGTVLMDEFADPTGGTVSIAAPSEAWMIARDASGGQLVAGHATATFSPSERIVVDRLSGYADVSLALTDVTWCGERPDAVDSLIVTGGATVTGNDGIVAEGESWGVEFP